MFFRVDYSMSEGRYDLYISDAEYMRDNGKFECRLKEDGTGVELYTKVSLFSAYKRMNLLLNFVYLFCQLK